MKLDLDNRNQLRFTKMMILLLSLLMASFIILGYNLSVAWSLYGLKTWRSEKLTHLPAMRRPNVCKNSPRNHSLEPVIYFITPTYPRLEQVAELTRLAHTLMHVPGLHWIVADDNKICSHMLTHLLEKFGISFTHISSPKPLRYNKYHKRVIARGVSNRRAALDWIRSNVRTGVIYFGDDDNTYDLRLFEEIRDTKIVSMLPVGLIGSYAVSAPVVKNGKVIGFFDHYTAHRKFAVDMAGFAVNVEYFLRFPNATMAYKPGYEEDNFLRKIGITLDMIEPKADNCTQVLVWHTRTRSAKKVPELRIDSISLDNSLDSLLHELTYLGMAKVSKTRGIDTYISRDASTIKV